MLIQTYYEREGLFNNTKLEKFLVLNKEEVHNRNLFHKSVHLLLVDKHKNILVRKRLEEELRYKNMFTSTIGTHVLLNKNYFESLSEIDSSLKEEDLEFLGEFRVKDDYENEICGLYLGNFENNILYDKKNYSFINIDLLFKTEITPHLREGLKLYLRGLEK